MDRSTYLIAAGSDSSQAKKGPVYRYSKPIDIRWSNRSSEQPANDPDRSRDIMSKTEVFLNALKDRCRLTQEYCWALGGEYFEGKGDGPTGGDVNPYCLVNAVSLR